MERPEIVIGLVGAVGTDLGAVAESVQSALNQLDYKSDVIGLSDLLRDYPDTPPFKTNLKDTKEMSLEDVRIDRLMTAGDEFREAFQRGDAMAMLAVARVAEVRMEKRGGDFKTLPNHAFILRSLKHPKEVETLRAIYGDSFFLLSAYRPKGERQDALERRIADSHNVFHQEKLGPKALALLERDQEETDNKFGQQVRKTFWLGDGYVDVSRPSINDDINRLMQIWFGHPYHTPTRDEYLMFSARAAALRSASMGRQVGAVIATTDGSIVSTGTNEVPKAFGGQYWEGDDPDMRDHVQGFDSSDTMRRGLLENLLGILGRLGYLSEEKADIHVQQLVENLLHGEDKALISSAEFSALTEYQRPIHAEMSAIIDAARRGVALDGMTLFSTAFPCHGCARHIVGAGIRRVVYIEPYPKSLVGRLYPDSISVDDPKCESKRVQFVPFVGLAPRRYMELFRMGDRKDEYGRTVKWKPTEAFPRVGNWESLMSLIHEQKYMRDYSRAKEQLIEDSATSAVNTERGEQA